MKERGGGEDWSAACRKCFTPFLYVLFLKRPHALPRRKCIAAIFSASLAISRQPERERESLLSHPHAPCVIITSGKIKGPGMISSPLPTFSHGLPEESINYIGGNIYQVCSSRSRVCVCEREKSGLRFLQSIWEAVYLSGGADYSCVSPHHSSSLLSKSDIHIHFALRR